MDQAVADFLARIRKYEEVGSAVPISGSSARWCRSGSNGSAVVVAATVHGGMGLVVAVVAVLWLWAVVVPRWCGTRKE